MLSRIHNKLGTAGLVVAIVALVAALGGAAWAAGGLTAQQEKQVKKIAKKEAKKFAGKRGATGPAGAAGAAGAKGATGPAGTAGGAGAKGATGPKGATGKIGTPGPPGVTGATGATGETGETGFTETLPSGKTETGRWAYGKTKEAQAWTAISFNIPLASDPTLHYINGAGKEILKGGTAQEEAVTSTVCLGTAKEPAANPGNLCVYASSFDFSAGAKFDRFFSNTATGGPQSELPSDGDARAGAVLVFDLTETEGKFNEASNFGSFAVTAP